VSRRQDGRDADRGIQTRSTGCANIRTRDLKMSQVLTVAEKEPASGRESHRSKQSERNSRGREAVGSEESWIRGSQEVIEEHQTQSGRTGRRGQCPDGVRTDGAR